MSKSLQTFVAQAKEGDSYWVEHAKLHFSIALEKQRRLSGISYAALAKKIGASTAFITKVFRGDSNLTIESMDKLARATGGRVNIQIINEKTDSKIWVGTLAKLPDAGAKSGCMKTGNVITFSSYATQKRTDQTFTQLSVT